MPFEFGDVVPFPFTNQANSKKRPAVVVSKLAYNRIKPDVVLMAITSQMPPARHLAKFGFRTGSPPACSSPPPSSPCSQRSNRPSSSCARRSPRDRNALQAAIAQTLG
jgi:hypothetical protein